MDLIPYIYHEKQEVIIKYGKKKFNKYNILYTYIFNNFIFI